VTDQSNLVLESEEARIKSAYALRQGSSRYSWFNQGQLFRVQGLERDVLTALRLNGFEQLQDKQILEIGCGRGHWLREFIKWGACPANVTGVDLIADHVGQARELCPRDVQITCGNAATLEFGSRRFDCVLQFTVFTSVLDFAMKQQMAREMVRVLKDDGIILWYDYHVNNPANQDVRGIRNKEIADLFPNCKIQLKRVTLVPQLARLIAPWSWLTCYGLERLKLLNSHYLGVIRKIRSR
jgi:ubiquinone/menaquinone biosynthesis C-methylase UbiE